MSIDADTLAAIRERVDIVALIGQTVALRRSGRRFVGLCPFHAEKSPSLSVAADKKLFHCFGCGAGGDALAFVMRARGLDFHAAVRALAADSGVPMADLPPHQQRAHEARDHLWRLNDAARDIFAEGLWAPAGGAARAYLKERGISARVARSFGVGLGPPLSTLLDALAARGGWDRDDVAEAGLLSDPGGHLLMTDRLVFPIAGPEGRVSGFGGRRLGDGGGPKYVNSRQSPVFHKGRLLFGLGQAAPTVRQAQSFTIVEGYLDVLALAGAGHGQAVAALGTALTAGHAELLRRLAPAALLVFDADRAGQAAAWRATGTLMAAGVRVEVALLPAGEDPASLAARHGAAALCAAVGQATPAIEFFMAAAFADSPGVEARAAAAWRLAPLIALCGELERDLYVHRLAKRVGLPVEALRRHLEAAPTAVAEPEAASPGPAEAAASRRRAAGGPAAGAPRGGGRLSEALSLELGYLRELLLYPSLRARFGELADFSGDAVMATTWEALADSAEPTDRVLGRTLGPALDEAGLQAVRQRVGVWWQGALDADDERANRTFCDVLACMKERHLDQALREVIAELRQTEQARPVDGDAVMALLRRKQRLTARRQALRQPPSRAVLPPNPNPSQDTQHR